MTLLKLQSETLHNALFRFVSATLRLSGRDDQAASTRQLSSDLTLSEVDPIKRKALENWCFLAAKPLHLPHCVQAKNKLSRGGHFLSRD